MNRCEQLECYIEEMKDTIAVQQYECIAMQMRLDELELKIDALINKPSMHQMFGGGMR